MTEDTKIHNPKPTLEQRKEQRKRVLYDWLLVDYSTVFSAENPIPLEVRKVKKALQKCLPENINKSDLKYALNWYSFRRNYLQAILEKTHRVNLKGEPVSEITDEDRIKAQVEIDNSHKLQKQYDEQKIVNSFKAKSKCVLDDWLYQQYPTVFNFTNPIPLAIGISRELMSQLPETVSLADFKTIMEWYCNRLPYHEAMLKHSHRINLQGELDGKVKDNDRKLAQDRFNNAQRKQGNSTKSQLKTESYTEIAVEPEPIEITEPMQPKPIEVTEPVQPTEEVKPKKLVLKRKVVEPTAEAIIEPTAEVTPVKSEPATVKVSNSNVAIAKGLKVTLVIEPASIPIIDSTGKKTVTFSIQVANTDIKVTTTINSKSYRKVINSIEELGADGCNAILQGAMKKYGVIEDAGLVVQPKKAAVAVSEPAVESEAA